MDPLVVKEFESLKQMMLNWRKGFLTWVESGTDNDYILREFFDDITNHLFPYVTSLLNAKHLTQKEATELMDYCYGEVEALRQDIKEIVWRDDG